MKKLITFSLIAALTLSVFAQAPQRLSYQAVIRNSSGGLVTSHAVGIKISILQGSATGTAVYVETHTPTTNANGLATVQIGGGSVVSGTFATINWSLGTYYLKTETDPAGNSSYTIVGTSQLSSVPYALNSKTSESVADNSITSAKIAGGSVTGAKIAQAGATSGQALKWNGTTWAPAADATGGGGGGWTDDGTMIRLSTMTDSVQLGSVGRVGKFNVGGNIGLSLPSSIYFGSDATRISGMVGGDMRLVAGDLSMMTTEDITFGHFGDETWIKFDNANKRVGIGTLAPTDRLHVVLGATSQGLSAVRGVATATAGSAYGVYGQSAGYKGRGVMGEATGTNSIGVMGLATNDNSTGVWGEGSNQGVYGFSSSAAGKGVYGKVTSPSGYSGYFEGGQFYVKGSAQVKDTLFANVVDAAKITTMPGLAHSVEGVDVVSPPLATSWASINSVTVNVPAPGYVLIFISFRLQSDHTLSDETQAYLGISKKSDGTGIKNAVHWYISKLDATEWAEEYFSFQMPMTVTTSGLQTFFLMGYRESGTDRDRVLWDNCYMTALYIPVAYGTVE